MKAANIISKPVNWQDFESLCKKLWGEIWKCPEIKKNGRSGQVQHGVDVYGIPFCENEYFGIQCKGKDEYSNSQLTELEIDEEISKANNFKPALKKLYFATTANKDSKIEEIIRIRNVENISKGLFEIHIYQWEDIVDLIEENKQTYNWYLNSIGFKTTQNVSITFQNSSDEIVLRPKFKQLVYKGIIKNEENEMLVAQLTAKKKLALKFSKIIQASGYNSTKVNLSFCPLNLVVQNSGDEPIENLKIVFQFKGEIQNISRTNLVNDVPQILSFFSHPYRFQFNDEFDGNIYAEAKILVSDDIVRSEDLFIKPLPIEHDVEIDWKMISKNFKKVGILKIKVKPEITEEIDYEIVENIEDVKMEKDEIQDFLVPKKEFNNDY